MPASVTMKDETPTQPVNLAADPSEDGVRRVKRQRAEKHYQRARALRHQELHDEAYAREPSLANLLAALRVAPAADNHEQAKKPAKPHKREATAPAAQDGA